MTEHQRRMEAVLYIIATELANLVYFAEKRDGSYAGAEYKRKEYQNAVHDLRLNMLDELDAKKWNWLRRLWNRLYWRYKK